MIARRERIHSMWGTERKFTEKLNWHEIQLNIIAVELK